MAENKKRNTPVYNIKNYGKQSTFASFLPGISGEKGIPIWCFYVNRGQCVVSFGVEDKDHAIMEFYPAHQAYQNVKITGFRTFIKKEGHMIEPFHEENIPHGMRISMNSLEIEEDNRGEGLLTQAVYYTLPGERIGGLVRKISITNTSGRDMKLEVLDGMPACIPYGINAESMKSMGQTIKAWMEVVYTEYGIPFMKARASTEDSAAVTEIAGGNFSVGCLADGSRLRVITDPELVFSYDTSLEKPVGFMEHSLNDLWQMQQRVQNIVPCVFYGAELELKAGETKVLYQLIGQVENKELLRQFQGKKLDEAYFEGKREEADTLTEQLSRHVRTRTANKDFDAYCQYTYMDNVLRGGYPMKLPGNKVFYIYSRKHGDLERDYNFFSILPEFYSQGNGNFRDINQNRRCDTFFAPFVGDTNIRFFYSLIQPDGYNPLGIEKVTYQYKKEGEPPQIFTPGELYRKLEAVYEDEQQREEAFGRIMSEAREIMNASFLEGYWSDHWTYNLDLVENYLSVFPEKEEELLYSRQYSYYRPQARVRKRTERCVKTDKGIRQYHAVEKMEIPEDEDYLLRGGYGKGEVIYVTLMEKLILLSALKFASLDAYGMGIEMEGGKPGWYDALNGLPGLFGSSMAESCELARNLDYTRKALKRYPRELVLSAELADLIRELEQIVKEEEAFLLREQKVLSFWNRINEAREGYWEKIYQGVSGDTKVISAEDMTQIIEDWYKIVRAGIDKACVINGGICPTYFTYRVTEYEEKEDGILPLDFAAERVPLFLEGPVRFLKLENTDDDKKALYQQVKQSDLYDTKLSMYKVNASLENASYEIGRARAFTPGWLENESIWLHMEYKYLLELLKSGLYEEFFADFHKAAVPFMDQKVYGRSIYENSSFLASSRNPNAGCHGKGFVARLSGSTVEFLQMWTIMMFGRHPFESREGELVLRFQPAVPGYLLGESREIEAVFLGETQVLYRFAEKKNYIPGEYRITEYTLVYRDGRTLRTEQEDLSGQPAEDIRNGLVKEIQAAVCGRER